MLVMPLKGYGCLKSYSLNNEIFYDVSTQTFNQNRFMPVILTFNLSDSVTLDAFFLLQTFLANDSWYQSAIFGTQISF